jgi:hypothetical protein
MKALSTCVNGVARVPAPKIVRVTGVVLLVAAEELLAEGDGVPLAADWDELPQPAANSPSKATLMTMIRRFIFSPSTR